jgi:hypothetical protein
MENSRFRSVCSDNYIIVEKQKYPTDVKQHLKDLIFPQMLYNCRCYGNNVI